MRKLLLAALLCWLGSGAGHRRSEPPHRRRPHPLQPRHLVRAAAAGGHQGAAAGRRQESHSSRARATTARRCSTRPRPTSSCRCCAPIAGAARSAPGCETPSIIPHVEARLKANTYAGIGEFHVFGADADLPVMRRLVELAKERKIFLHAHSDADAVERIFKQDPQARACCGRTRASTSPTTCAPCSPSTRCCGPTSPSATTTRRAAGSTKPGGS